MRGRFASSLVAELSASVLAREPQPAEQGMRLQLIKHAPGEDRPIRVRLTLSGAQDRPEIGVGARIQLRAPPMPPGTYDFARTAWFAGISATERTQARLSQHVRAPITALPAGATSFWCYEMGPAISHATS
jgi:competence protein ComEC